MKKSLVAIVMTAVLLWLTAAAWADTVCDFDNPCSVFTLGQCVDPPGPLPTVMPGGVTEYFLRLVTTTAPNHNTMTFDRADPGLFSQIVVDFDFRMTPAGPTSRADGFGFALLNTAFYQTTGAVCPIHPPFVAEEPNFTGSLGVAFDIYQSIDLGDINNNHISIHFDRVVLTQVDATPVVDRAGGQWVHAQIIMRPGDGFSDVSVILMPAGGQPITVIDRFPVPGFNPYEGRVFFGARSGGQSAHHDLDNIQVQFSGSPDPAVYGQWSDPLDAEIIPIHALLLPTGKVMYWQRGDSDDPDPHLWDPLTGTISITALPDYDIFCSGHSFLADGRSFVTGGHISDFVGLPHASIYDPFTDSWTRLDDMNAGRWYPILPWPTAMC